MIIIAAGSSLPFCGVDSQQLVLRAFSALGSILDDVKPSPLYCSPAWPDPSDPDYVNAAALVKTRMSPAALMQTLLGVEAAFGRTRARRNAPRTLDLDLIAYNDLVLGHDGDDLVLPHPRAADRGFVLAPIADIAPNWRHPVTGEGVSTMMERVSHDGISRI